MRGSRRLWPFAGRGVLAVAVLLALPASVRAAAGDLDNSFGSGGMTLGAVPHETIAFALQADGRIVVAGTRGSSADSRFFVQRYDARGPLDPSFGGGTVLTDFPDSPEAALTVFVEPGGKIIAAGRANVTVITGPSGFALARYDGAGALDPSFGAGGLVTTAFPGLGASVFRLARQSSGKLIAVGTAGTSSPVASDVALTRYDGNGTLDASFGSSGRVLTDLGTAQDVVGGAVVQTDDKIVVAGTAGLGASRMVTVVRYLPDGTLDGSFGTGGVVQTHPGTGDAIVLQPDGALVVAGKAIPGGEAQLIRYLQDGSPDPGFGTAGVVTTALPGAAGASDVVLQADGKLVVAEASGTNDFTLLRYDDAGALDPTFGSGGLVSVTPGVPPSFSGQSPRLVLQPDGRIVVAYGRHVILGSGAGAQVAVLLRRLGGTCGNGVTEIGEDCDDGNLTPGDGCDARCCVADGDGDGRCDSEDPCTGTPVAAAKPTIVVRKRTVPPAKLTYSGRVTLPFPFAPALDPVSSGVRLVIADPDAAVMDVAIPAGAFADPPGRGWKVSGLPERRRWTFVDKAAAPPSGLKKVVLKLKGPTSPGEVSFTATGASLDYTGLIQLPLAGVLGINAAAGQCASLSFPGSPGPACTQNFFTGLVACR